jgi:hypothetical protein
MEQLVQIFEELERNGWVCILKWDGQRTSMTKTVVVSRAFGDKLFRGDFHSFEQALEHLQKWLREESPASNSDT